VHDARPERPADRRTRRREQTLEEVLDRAVELMATDGVAGLTMTRLAGAMGIRPPSLYKYFPSALAVQDALFARGQRENLEAWRAAVADAAPGLASLRAGMRATGRWAVAHPVLAQLLFWRPVPGFTPSEAAFAPAVLLQELVRTALADAVAQGEVVASAATGDGMALLAVLHFGVISQHLANEPQLDWEHGHFTRQHDVVLELFTRAHAVR